MIGGGARFVEFELPDPSALEMDWNFTDRADRFYRTGLRLLRRGFFEDAEDVFGRATRYDPAHYRAWVCRTEALIILGRPDQAAELAEAALGRYGRNCELGAARGHVFFHRGHLELALECADIATRNAPDNGYAWLIAGEVRLGLPDGHEGAMACFDRARSALVPWPDLELRIALAMLEAGRLEPAIRSLGQLVKEEPRLPLAWILLGDAYRLGGKRRDSRACYQRAAALVPRLEALQRALSWKARLSDRWRGLRSSIARALGSA